MTFRWGILGAARIARSLIPAIREAGGEVVMVGAREPGSARVQDFAREWGVPMVGTYGDVMHADVDAVYNPLPNHLHLPWSEAAMRAGKHVLTEKPLSLNAGEAAHLAQVAAQTGRVLLEAFAYRFSPHHEALLQAVRAGEVGDVRAYRGAFGFTMRNDQDFRWDPAMGGGALYDVGCYTVNLARLLLGEPDSVTARARWTPGGVDVALSGVLEYAGALATVECAFDWLPDRMMGRCQVIGSEGQLELEDAYVSSGPDLRLTVNGEVRDVPAANGYARMVRHFQRAAGGEEAALYPPEDAVRQARVLDALLRSAREGARVVP
ncbi:Gfo/Idh/MocA family protein [Deinococcus aquiradiocola]|uniref:Oxidoreductase n=1 Tax=Deinococcus aquiradiocola TaxID=393059 RepID=A0A917PDY2_9DEIO|nr:Gfo/Idh/MocA family oxidoreductase [Deinococcus aquiradiocola]GGJ72218.1 oxidoreductase [Deinococcus aquiradiocola]